MRPSNRCLKKKCRVVVAPQTAFQPNLAVSNQIHVLPRTTNMLLWFLSMLASYVHAGATPTQPSPTVRAACRFLTPFKLRILRQDGISAEPRCFEADSYPPPPKRVAD